MIKKILLGSLLIVVGALAVFFAPALLAPVLTYESRVTINKPRPEVWKEFVNPENMGKWLEGFKSIETISGEPETIGSKYKIVIEENGERFEAIETVKEVVENEKFAFEIEGDALSNMVVIALVDKGLTTEVVQSEKVAAKGVLYKAMFYWMQSWLQERSQNSLNNLKKFIEEE